MSTMLLQELPERLKVPTADQLEAPGTKLSVIVPAYREARHIRDNLSRLLTELDLLGRTYEVIVVSDGNTDGTAREAERVVSPHIKVIEYDRNMGQIPGRAVRNPDGSMSYTAPQANGYVATRMFWVHPDGTIYNWRWQGF